MGKIAEWAHRFGGTVILFAVSQFTWVGTSRSDEVNSSDAARDGEPRVARLISELGSDSFSARTYASQALADLGPDARVALELASLNNDPETRLRASELLTRLKARDLWAAAKVDPPTGKVSAATVLAAMADQSGNRVLLGDQYGNFHDEEIEFDRPLATFWELMDDVCRKSGNRVRAHYDARQPGLVVVAGVPAKFPLAYCGPVRAQVTSARRVFTEELDYEDLDSEKTHTFQLTLQMTWEDRFRLVAYRSQPELLSAVTDTGIELSASQVAGTGWNVAGSGTRQLTMSLRVHPPATTARKLDTLKLKWGLMAVGDMASLDVTNWQSTDPHYQDDVELIVESAQVTPGGRCEMSIVINRDLMMPDPHEIIFQENELELFDEQGRPFRKQGQTNSATDTGSRSKLTFVGESADAVPARLRLSYPKLRAQKDMEIVFRDVPLPVGKPE